jgi:autotransporter-associated beta strand protein
MVCALSSQTVLAKKHHKPHKPSTKTSAGTLSLGTNSYQGLATLSAGTLLLAPTSYQGLIISSGYEALIANSAGTLTLANSSQSGTTISYGGTLTVANIASLVSSGTIVSNSTQIFPGSAGVLSVDLGNSSSSMGTLLINNAVNYSGAMGLVSFHEPVGTITLSASSNYVIPSDIIVVSSGTLSVEAPEPTSLGLVALAALIFLRRPSRK